MDLPIQFDDGGVRVVADVAERLSSVCSRLTGSSWQAMGSLDTLQVPQLESRLSAVNDIAQDVTQISAVTDPVSFLDPREEASSGGASGLHRLGHQVEHPAFADLTTQVDHGVLDRRARRTARTSLIAGARQLPAKDPRSATRDAIASRDQHGDSGGLMWKQLPKPTRSTEAEPGPRARSWSGGSTRLRMPRFCGRRRESTGVKQDLWMTLPVAWALWIVIHAR